MGSLNVNPERRFAKQEGQVPERRKEPKRPENLEDAQSVGGHGAEAKRRGRPVHLPVGVESAGTRAPAGFSRLFWSLGAR